MSSRSVVTTWTVRADGRVACMCNLCCGVGSASCDWSDTAQWLAPPFVNNTQCNRQLRSRPVLKAGLSAMRA